MATDKKQKPSLEQKPDDPDRGKEDALVDAGSEYSFPASDPPSYMGGAAVAGPPPHENPPREPVSQELANPDPAESKKERPDDGKVPEPKKDR